jgi:membrane associated rhomboid family serine protease
MITFTFLSIIIAFSVYCFSAPGATGKYSFYPYLIKREKEHYRFLTHAFIHGDLLHLSFNCLALYSFGLDLEIRSFPSVIADGQDLTPHDFKLAKVYYLILFTGGIYAASITEYIRNKDNPSYSSVGASGAISSILFAWIILNPERSIGMFFIPFPLPGWVWGVLLLGISAYLIFRKRKGTYSDGISHEAHFWGAIFGVIFVAILEPGAFKNFVDYIFHIK